jgi:tetratricopeptide (TPR) repeat protein
VDLSAWFQELRRRRVIRALLGWGLLSFAVLQVVEPVQHALGMGDWFLKVVVANLALGFPVTAGLAWAFDLTRKGIERTSPLAGEGSGAQGPSRAAPALAIALVGGVIGAGVAGLAGWHLWGRVPPTGPDGRITVAVADIMNETKELDLDGLSGQLITSLEQSQRLRVLTRSRMVDVLRQLGKPSVPVVDELLGREMALVANVHALVVATIRRFDDLYVIDMKVLDPRTSEYFFTLKEEGAGKGKIPAMLDRLSASAREKLREAPAQVNATKVAVADATTGSHEAWKHYFEGQKWEDVADLWLAIRSYERAIAADPRFAMAHYRIAYLGEFVGYPRKLRDAAMDAAYKEIDRVPAKEKVLFHAWKAHVDGRNADAHALYAQAAAAYPLDKEVLYLAGDLHLHEGNASEALPWFEKAVALDPSWMSAEQHIVSDVLPLLGRQDEALSRARRVAERFPGQLSRSFLVAALNEAGRHEEAVEVSRAAAAADPQWVPQLGLARSLIMADRFEEAEKVLRPFVAPSNRPDERTEATFHLACALAQQGRRREAIRVTRTLGDIPEANFQGKPVQMHWMLWALQMNEKDHRAALHEAEILRSYALVDEGLFTGYLIMGEDGLAAEAAPGKDGSHDRALYESLADWRRGEHGKAIVRIRDLMARNPAARTFFSWWLADVAFDAGRDEEAVAATTVYENARVQISVWRSWGLARLLYKKALAQERKGDLADARVTVERLLGWWTKADPDLPLLTETRALCRRLECDAPGSGDARPMAAIDRQRPRR